MATSIATTFLNPRFGLFINTLRNIDTNIYIVTDGGMKDRSGTTTTELMSIEGPVSGYAEHSSSFRSEAYGMMAGFNFLSLIVQVYNIHIAVPRKILLYCDSLSLVRWVQKIIAKETYPRIFLRSESDVILQISQDVNFLHTVNCQISLDHVKGHQDRCDSLPGFIS